MISLFVFCGFFFGSILDVPTRSAVPLECFPCHLEKVPESSRPVSFPGVGKNP